MFNGYGEAQRVDARRRGRHQAFFDGGTEIDAAARAFAGDVVDFLAETGSELLSGYPYDENLMD